MKQHQKQYQLEPQIKAVALNYLIEKGMLSQKQTVINEFTLDGYTRRVDLLMASQRGLIAIEIKSEADSLQRLKGQTEKYLEYFDRLIIIAASKHIPHIIKNVPARVAVWEVCKDDIFIRQRGKNIPVKNKTKFLSLMKANELLKLSNKFKVSLPSRNRKTLVQALEKLSINILRQAAITNLQSRYALTSSFFWKNTHHKKVLPEHISLLSPYREARISQRKIQQNNALFWSKFHLQERDGIHFREMIDRHDSNLFGYAPQHIQDMLAT